MEGRSWTLLSGGTKTTVSVEALTGTPMLPAQDALSAIASRLVPEFEKAGLVSPNVGKIISNSAQAELGLYVDDGAFSGTAVGLRCGLSAETIDVTVAASSKFRRAVVWLSLGLGLAAGLYISSQTFETWDGVPRLVAGLFIGLAIAIGMMVISGRVLKANARSEELTAKLQSHLAPLLEELQA